MDAQKAPKANIPNCRAKPLWCGNCEQNTVSARYVKCCISAEVLSTDEDIDLKTKSIKVGKMSKNSLNVVGKMSI